MADKKQYLYNQEGKIVGELGTDFPNVKNFETYVNTRLNEEISALENKFNNTLPIGTILINEVASNFNPGIGTWEIIGSLQDGQTIIGGSTDPGEVKSHTHTQNPHNHIGLRDLKSGNDYDKNSRGGGNPDLHSVYAYNSDGSNKDYYFPSREGESGNSGTLYTNKVTASNNPTGGNYNKPYGLGLGTKYVWKRIG